MLVCFVNCVHFLIKTFFLLKIMYHVYHFVCFPTRMYRLYTHWNCFITCHGMSYVIILREIRSIVLTIFLLPFLNQSRSIFTHLQQLILGQGLVVTCLEFTLRVTEAAMVKVVALHCPVFMVDCR